MTRPAQRMTVSPPTRERSSGSQGRRAGPGAAPSVQAERPGGGGGSAILGSDGAARMLDLSDQTPGPRAGTALAVRPAACRCKRRRCKRRHGRHAAHAIGQQITRDDRPSIRTSACGSLRVTPAAASVRVTPDAAAVETCTAPAAAATNRFRPARPLPRQPRAGRHARPPAPAPSPPRRARAAPRHRAPHPPALRQCCPARAAPPPPRPRACR